MPYTTLDDGTTEGTYRFVEGRPNFELVRSVPGREVETISYDPKIEINALGIGEEKRISSELKINDGYYTANEFIQAASDSTDLTKFHSLTEIFIVGGGDYGKVNYENILNTFGFSNLLDLRKRFPNLKSISIYTDNFSTDKPNEKLRPRYVPSFLVKTEGLEVKIVDQKLGENEIKSLLKVAPSASLLKELRKRV